MRALYLLLVAAAGLAAGSASADIPQEVRIGGVFELTGTWPSEGGQAKTATEFAISDFNGYLEALGADWSMSLRSEDSQGKPAVALQMVQELKGALIDMVVGMAFSNHILTSKSYIDANDIIVVSHAAQSENLAIANDTVFRLVPHDGNQSPAVAAAIEDAGVEVLVTVSRADIWGDGLRDGISSSFGGETIKLIRYDPDSVDFSITASILDERVGELIAAHGADKVGVFYSGNDELLAIIQQLKPYDSVSKVRWFGTTTQAYSQELLGEHVREFVESVNFTATWYAEPGPNGIKQALDERFVTRYGHTPSIYGYAAYDAVWLLGLSILQTQSVDTEVVAAAIPHVAARTLGAGGSLALTDGGDLAGFSIQMLHVSNGTWVHYADYDAESMTLLK